MKDIEQIATTDKGYKGECFRHLLYTSSLKKNITIFTLATVVINVILYLSTGGKCTWMNYIVVIWYPIAISIIVDRYETQVVESLLKMHRKERIENE